jgi:hypothetical protein
MMVMCRLDDKIINLPFKKAGCFVKKPFLILIFIFITFLSYSFDKKIGISRVNSKFKMVDPNIHFKLEEILISSVSELPGSEKYSLDLNRSIYDLNKNFDLWKKSDLSNDQNYKDIESQFEEIKDMDILIASQVTYLVSGEEKDFYDTNIINYRTKLEFQIAIYDVKSRTLIDENTIEIDYLSKVSLDDSKNQVISYSKKKIDLFLSEVSKFKEEIHAIKGEKLFIWIDAGRSKGIRVGNILTYFDTNDSINREHTVVQVIKVEEDKSLANILYTKGDVSDKAKFIKTNKINLELQLGAGFALTGLTVDPVTIFPAADIRFLIPVGLIYFHPLLQLEFNFYYKDTKILVPFTFETGFLGKYNIHRFEFSSGFNVGVLFSPDTNNTLQADSAVLRPYLQLAALVNTGFKVYGEFGYKYYIEDNFYKNWKIDLTGVYFIFGFGVTF